MYDKDWEVHLALNNPLDPIHRYMEESLQEEDDAHRIADEQKDLKKSDKNQKQ